MSHVSIDVGDQVVVAVNPEVNGGKGEAPGFVTALSKGKDGKHLAAATVLCTDQRLTLFDVEVHPSRAAFEAAHEQEITELLEMKDNVTGESRYRREDLARWVQGCWPRSSTVGTTLAELATEVASMRLQLRQLVLAAQSAPVE